MATMRFASALCAPVGRLGRTHGHRLAWFQDRPAELHGVLPWDGPVPETTHGRWERHVTRVRVADLMVSFGWKMEGFHHRNNKKTKGTGNVFMFFLSCQTVGKLEPGFLNPPVEINVLFIVPLGMDNPDTSQPLTTVIYTLVN